LKSEPIARPRVERLLQEALESAPLTLVRAPLGSGKSIAAGMAFADKPGTVWLEASPWHRDAFANAFVEAVRGVRPEFGRMTLGAVEAGASAAHVGARFAQELTHVAEPLLLIVDNVQIFSDDPGFAQFLDAAITALPAPVRILALGRTLPESGLGESFARGRATLLDGDFLAFDRDEIRDLAAGMGRELDARELDGIAEATEGWATGVSLALASAPASLPAASGPRSVAEAYLTERLLPSLPPDALAFLERTAVFETLDVHVLAASSAFSDAAARIDALRTNGALVTQVRDGAYRIHPILRELALGRLKASGAAIQAHADAARAYAAVGEIAAALFHAQATGDPQIAAQFLRKHAGAAVATGQHARTRAVAARIDLDGPDAGVRWFVEGLLEKSRGTSEARSSFERAAEASLAAQDDATGFAARIQTLEHDIGQLAPVDESVLRDLRARAQSFGVEARAAVAVLHGWARAVAHDFSGALEEIAAFENAGDATMRFNRGVLAAYAQTALGEIDAAEETLDALVQSLESDDRVVLQTLTLVWFARLALAWGRTNVAGDAAAQAERLSSALDLRSEEAALYLALAEVATHRGDVRAAVTYAQRARGRADRAWYAADVERVRAFAEIALARAAFLGHDNAIARDLAVRAASAAEIPSAQKAVALTEAAVYTLLCDSGNSAEAIERARAAVSAATPIDAADAVAIAVADDVLAFLDAADGRAHESALPACEPFTALLQHRRGLVTLEHAGLAVGNARRGTGGPVAFETAIEQLTRDGPRFEARLARAYAATFIKAGHAAENAAVSDLDLTPREREILELLVDGLTNKEIAQRLIVSPRTIETHVERVLGKLEVGSRSRAIAKALRLGLVSLGEPTL
jgi:LuxR family transcriptional regulator, maltose regulon positive regulatory protein